MAISARFVHTLAWLVLALVNSAHGSPVNTSPLGALSKRWDPIVVVTGNGTINVTDPTTLQAVAQGSASDGSGTDFSATAIIWIVYCLVIGIPLALAGLKLSRIATGAGIGLAATVCLWAAFINTESAQALSDMVITLIPVCLFVPGFLFGLFDYGRLAGTILLNLASGYSIGIRICLFRENLIIHHELVYGNWLISSACAFLNVLFMILKEEIATTLSCAAVGTFLIALGIDLIIKKQEGMSSGLRYMFDRNKHHYLAIVYKGWKPPTATIIILAVSLGLIPVLAYMQYFVFRRLLRRTSAEEIDEKPSSFPTSAPDTRTPSSTKSMYSYFGRSA
ncbi:hypothetical protein AcW1_003448 [Taiwanofungus camphoratus]|nr:hypothetical protein AcV5_002091 [Antrodia cinnamomea]KAI0941596.1 hypothetical protein AcW1_003448 [Antrodia cinnamomea]